MIKCKRYDYYEGGVMFMSRVCCICNKAAMSGNKVSHSNRKTRRAWKANVQKIKVKRNGAEVYDYVCTRCLRSGKVERV